MAPKLGFLLLFMLSTTQSLVFGTLETKIVPLSPRAKLLQRDSQGVTRGFIYLIKPSRVIVCCDNEDSVHYFMQSNDNLTRALWTSSVGQYAKIVIFKELREWYTGVTKEELCSTMTELDDAAAWVASEGLCDL